jgi:hypothetical protein
MPFPSLPPIGDWFRRSFVYQVERDCPLKRMTHEESSHLQINGLTKPAVLAVTDPRKERSVAHTACSIGARAQPRGVRRRLAAGVMSMLIGACLLSACGNNETPGAQAPSWDNACLNAPLNGPQPTCTPTVSRYTGPHGTSTTPPSGACPPECGDKKDRDRDVAR